MNYGTLVYQPLAGQILAANQIDQYTPIDPFQPESVTYQGKQYWILQRDMYFAPDETSPDGYHLVYAPSQDEINQQAAIGPEVPKPPSSFNWNNVLILAGLGIAAYVAVNFFGKRQ